MSAFQQESSNDNNKISSVKYYGEYHGHLIPHLQLVHNTILGDRACCFLVGDSSLDNKYWIDGQPTNSVNGYQTILQGGMIKDIAYWVNKYICEYNKEPEFFYLNASVEESTLKARYGGQLLPQDKFVQDHIQNKDILICSVGGNDIALKPDPSTILNLGTLLMQSHSDIDTGAAPGFSHFYDLWKTQTEDYIKSLCLKNKPKVIVVCTLYYLDEKPGGSWAENTLSITGYNNDPTKIQLLISKLFQLATCQIQIDGSIVIPFPLFKILDGKNTDDYVQRVEPSVLGGEKIGKALVEKILEVYI